MPTNQTGQPESSSSSHGGPVTTDDVRSFRRQHVDSFDLARHVEHSPSRLQALDENVSETEDDDSEIERKRTRRLKKVGSLSKPYSEDEEKTVLRKLDRKLILFLAFLYLLSFLDRSNIGNARIAGLEEALDLSDRQFGFILLAFYITYITFEWMILLYRLVPAHIYIGVCVFSWGVVASLQSVVTSFGQLLALRACLGVTEAAFGPGVPFYMTFFYRRSELAYRVGLQIAAAPLATSFASSLAWVIVKLSQNGPLEPWRALFLFEGMPSVITAVFAWYYIPDSPETARYLNTRERKVARLRMEEEKRQEDMQDNIEVPGLSSKSSILARIRSSTTVNTLTSIIPWLQALIFLSINVSFASLPVFLPTIIRSMEFSALTSQILSAPPYLLSFGFVLLIGRISDSIPNSRGYCLILCSGLSAISYFIIALFGILGAQNKVSDTLSITIRYIAVYGAAMGLFSSVVLIITWNLNNQPSRKEKGLAMMVMNVVGQCGPLIGVSIFPKRDEPQYVSGMMISGFFMSGVVLLSTILRWKLKRMNRNGSRDGKGSYEMVGLQPADGEEENRATIPGEDAQALIREPGLPKGIDTSFRYML